VSRYGVLHMLDYLFFLGRRIGPARSRLPRRIEFSASPSKERQFGVRY
jgi:hypothetical protein